MKANLPSGTQKDVAPAGVTSSLNGSLVTTSQPPTVSAFAAPKRDFVRVNKKALYGQRTVNFSGSGSEGYFYVGICSLCHSFIVVHDQLRAGAAVIPHVGMFDAVFLGRF